MRRQCIPTLPGQQSHKLFLTGYYEEILYKEDVQHEQGVRRKLQATTLEIKSNPRALHNIKEVLRRSRPVTVVLIDFCIMFKYLLPFTDSKFVSQL